MAEENELCTKYSFLLQPVRDLQKNWDIDISHLLEEFVEKLRELNDEAKSEDGKIKREEKFNFAEAAILIQGSTMVYGKKVEYVHELARGFYEQLRDKKTSRKGNIDNMEEEEDDVDEVAQQLDDPCELIQFTNLKSSDWKTLTLRNEAKPPTLLPQIPISLMPLADFEKTNVPLYSSRNTKELIGKKDDFIINTGFIHKSGALLLDLVNAKLLDDFVMQEQSCSIAAHADESMLQNDEQIDIVVDNEHNRSCTSEMEKVRRITSATNLNTLTGRDTSHVELVSDVAVDMRNSTTMNCAPVENKTDDLGCDGPEFVVTEDGEGSYHHPADEEAFDEAYEDEPVMDLFRLQKCKHAPYRVQFSCNFLPCKPSFVPELVEKRRLKKKEKLGLQTLSAFNNFLQQHVYYSLPKGNLHVLDNDFSVIFGKLIRNLEKHRMNVLKSRTSQHERLYEQSDDVRFDKDEVEVGEYEAANNGYSSDEYGSTSDVDDDGNLTFANMPNDDLQDRVRVSSLYMNFDDPDLVLKPAEQMTYQDLLKVHLQKYWSSAEETTSKLCKRVQQWEEKVQPLLEEEETRRDFNIHLYGSELLDQYESVGQIKNFAELVKNENEQYDISRYYLASLMLASTGNIELNLDCRTKHKKDGRNLLLKLLKKERHHQQFSESYRLPT
uniref:Condensin-2 complex subunit H2 n=1 Tax=Setaria digitata TaxID=48799 RepID=A0A915PNM2_9BILA